MLSKPFYVAEGVTSNQGIGFNAGSMRIDNFTNGWVKIDGEYALGPLAAGYVTIWRPARSQASMEVTLTAPGGAVAAGNGQSAAITWFDEEQPPAAASYQAITASIIATLTTLEQIRSAAGAATDVGYRAADLTIPVSLRDGSAGNSNILGTAAAPIRNDPTGTTRQPVNLNQVGGAAYALGTALMAASQPVTLASDQPTIPVTPGTPAAPTNSTTAALAASQVLKSSAGRLWGASGFSNNVAAQYIQLHNATALPANGTVPIVVFQVPALSPFSIDYGFWGRQFSTGIVIANSTTLGTLTTGAADCWFDGQVT